MAPYNPDIHHRRSVRLKGYDYASAGLYLVTICTQNRECLLGEIKNGEMVLNDAGHMVEKWYYKTQDNFPDIVCHEMIVMPNHFHCIWENVGLDNASRIGVGANPCVRPTKQNDDILGAHMGAHTTDELIQSEFQKGAHTGAHTIDELIQPEFQKGAHTGAPLRGQPNGNDIVDDSDLVENISGSPLSAVVGWFKTMSTNEYIRGVKQLNWPPFDRKFWQRNYYEHIIRNEFSYNEIANYIINNPARWQEDNFYSQ